MRIEFWMGFGERYLRVFEVLYRLGLLSSVPIEVEGAERAAVEAWAESVFERDLALGVDDGDQALLEAALLLGDAGANAKESRYVMTLRGPIPVELPHDDLDYTHYIEKQLKPIADAVLQFLGLSFNDIVGGKQLELFP